MSIEHDIMIMVTSFYLFTPLFDCWVDGQVREEAVNRGLWRGKRKMPKMAK
jgi:hypothetical protein